MHRLAHVELRPALARRLRKRAALQRSRQAPQRLGGAAAVAGARSGHTRSFGPGRGSRRAGRLEAGTQTDPPRGNGVAAAAGGALEGARAGASAARGIGRAGGAAVSGLGAAALGLGMGAMGGAYEGARYMLGGGNGGALSFSSEAQDMPWTLCSSRWTPRALRRASTPSWRATPRRRP